MKAELVLLELVIMLRMIL